MEKLEILKEQLAHYASEGLTLAFSGGTDSSLLLALAAQTGYPVRAVLFHSQLMPLRDADIAGRVAAECGVPLDTLEIDVTTSREVMRNDPRRCYFCKRAIFRRLRAWSAERGLPHLADGTNADDLKVYRPGLQALRELGVHSPLAECGFTKAEVRAAAAQLGLSVASRPPAPCMATRLPYGTALDFSVLRRLEQGEEALHVLGFPVCRLRLHGNVVRIEVPADRIGDLAAVRDTVLAALKPLNFPYYTLDLTGFRSGSMDIEVDRHG